MPRLILSMKPFYLLFLPPSLSLSSFLEKEALISFFDRLVQEAKRSDNFRASRFKIKDFKVIIPSEISLEISLFLKIERGRKKKNSKRRRMPNKLGKED